jgi:hypothetical protein
MRPLSSRACSSIYLSTSRLWWQTTLWCVRTHRYILISIPPSWCYVHNSTIAHVMIAHCLQLIHYVDWRYGERNALRAYLALYRPYASRGSKTAAYSCNCQTYLQDKVILSPVALSHRDCYGTLSRQYVAFLCVPLDLMPIAMMMLLFKKKLLYMHAGMVIICFVRSLFFWVQYVFAFEKQTMSYQRSDVVLMSFCIEIDIACSNCSSNLEIKRLSGDLATSYTPSTPTK